MMNSLYQQLREPENPAPLQQGPPQKQSQSQSYQNNKNLLKSILKSSNPSQVIESMVQQNPVMRDAMILYQSSGKSPKDFFFQFAQQKGIDPNQFINSLLQD